MDSTFWIKFALGFLVGDAWVSLSTVLADRFGSKVVGLIGVLPSSIVVTLLYRSGGAKFASAMGKSLMVSGLIAYLVTAGVAFIMLQYMKSWLI